MEKRPALVVDDSETVQALTKHMLEIEGLECVQALDGKAGLQLLHEGLNPCLILLDIWMPRMTGIQFLQSAQSYVQRIPTFVISVSGDKPLIDEIRALGARGLFTKPLTQKQLVAAHKFATQTHLSRVS